MGRECGDLHEITIINATLKKSGWEVRINTSFGTLQGLLLFKRGRDLLGFIRGMEQLLACKFLLIKGPGNGIYFFWKEEHFLAMTRSAQIISPNDWEDALRKAAP